MDPKQPNQDGSAGSLDQLVRRWRELSALMWEAKDILHEAGDDGGAVRAIGCSQTYAECANAIEALTKAPNSMLLDGPVARSGETDKTATP